MTKDPAFLFYFQDFLVGTTFMSHEERGCYISILCHLADKGRLSLEHMFYICKPYVFSDLLKSKFEVDSEGYFFHRRLHSEVVRRCNYSESRRKNRKGNAPTYVEHMETVTGAFVFKNDLTGETSTQSPDADAAKRQAKNDATEGIDDVTYSNDKNKKRENRRKSFENIWVRYPKSVGKKAAWRFFGASVSNKKDWIDINLALDNYVTSADVRKGFVQNGGTWFNNWRDWIINPIKKTPEQEEQEMLDKLKGGKR